MKKMWKVCLILFCIACNKSHTDMPLPAEDTSESPAEELIIGGHNVTKKSEIAAITVSLLDTQKGTLCTASILSERIAITAAHCVAGGDANFMQISFGLRATGSEVRPVEKYAVPSVWHEHNASALDTGDIALVEFSGGLPPSAHAATLMKASHHLTNGELVTIAGFGINNGRSDEGAGRLRTVDVKIANARYSRTEVSLDQTNKKGACHGDSGGPAFIQDNNGGLLFWGVTSRGINDPSDQCIGEAVYTRIQPYARWINSVVRGWGR